MKEFINQEFKMMFDDGGAILSDLIFKNCIFDNCALSISKNPSNISKIKNVIAENLSVSSCDIGPCIFEDVLIENLRINEILIFHSPLFKNVKLSGNIGNLKINSAAFSIYDRPDLQNCFNELRNNYYKNIEYALDISEAKFLSFDCNGIPSDLIKRNKDSQFIIRKKNISNIDRLNKEFAIAYPYVFFMVKMFLDSPHLDEVLVAPLAKPTKKYKPILEGLTRLQELGIVDED